MAVLHELIADHLGDAEPIRSWSGSRRPVRGEALIAAVNSSMRSPDFGGPVPGAACHSGAKIARGSARVGRSVRTDRAAHARSPATGARRCGQVLARAHQNLIGLGSGRPTCCAPRCAISTRPRGAFDEIAGRDPSVLAAHKTDPGRSLSRLRSPRPAGRPPTQHRHHSRPIQARCAPTT